MATVPETSAVEAWLRSLPGASDLPFWPPPDDLYTVGRLYAGFSPDDPTSLASAWDERIFRWTLDADGRPRPLGQAETVAVRLHDAAMDRLVCAYIDRTPTVGFMGGHEVSRADPSYAKVVALARHLRRRGYMIVTGGGPGLMEAANLGAFFAPHDDAALGDAVAVLGEAPDFGGDTASLEDSTLKARWARAAAEVRSRLLGRWDAPPSAGGESLGIPTWYYGAEPPNLFAAASGKYFMNSVREDGLVSVASGGLVFAKGAAGTVQEIFQNVNYNYYRGAGVEPTPMVFLDADFWTARNLPKSGGASGGEPLLPLVQKMAADADPPFAASILVSDDAAAIADFLDARNERRRGVRLADLRVRNVGSLPPPRRLA